jgi:hypothetical protein
MISGQRRSKYGCVRRLNEFVVADGAAAAAPSVIGQTRGARSWRRLLVAVALSQAAAPAFASPAFGAADPVASGSVRLNLSAGFKRQLQQNGVKVQPKQLKVNGGSFDSVKGIGSLSLNSRLKFKHGNRIAALRKLTVNLGKGGTLKAGRTKLFRLRGGNLDPHGFGAEINRVKLKLLPTGAKTLNHRLGLHSLHAGNAGTLSVSEQPQTVRVASGETKVVPSLDPNNGVAFKLQDHCIDPIATVSPIPPARQDSNLVFFFPAVGGTVGPNGKAGLTLHTGGTQVSKDPGDDAGPCGSVPDDANVQTSDLQIDLLTNHAFGQAVINGYPPPLGGPKGVAIAFNVDRKLETVDAHPKAKKITIGNLVLSLSRGSAIFLNIVFPNSSGNPSRDFKTGDLFGTATMTLNTR